MPVFNPALPPQEVWKSPTLLNSWVYWGAGATAPGYWKDSLGVVHLRGLLRSGLIGQTAFMLPIGYRPEFREVHATVSQAADSSTVLTSRVDIVPDGSVVPLVGGNSYFSLDGITFRAV